MATIPCQGEITADSLISPNVTSLVDNWNFIYAHDKTLVGTASATFSAVPMLQASGKTKDNWEWIFHFDKNLLVPTMSVRNMGSYSGATKTRLPFYWGR